MSIEIRNVSKNFNAFKALNEINLNIQSGELVALLGPSGCGKTTTLRLIAGLEHASTGRILIDGAEVTHLSAADRDVSMVFQSYALFPHMTVMENTCYGLRASGLSKAESESRAAEKLRLVGLTGYERRLPSELSGGQQQRVAVARAIVLEPKVLLFDEPLSNLDAKLRRRVRDEIRALQQQLRLTVVYVTHDQEEALAVSDRIIVMSHARIAQDGTPRDLYEAPASRFVADFIGNANLRPVALRHADATWGEAALAGTTLRVAHRGVPEGPALLAVRPHAVRLSAAGPGIAARIAHAAYLGGHMEYGVAIPGFEAELFATGGDVSAAFADGQDVHVSFDPAGVAVVRPE
jgi:iron(III) transport system ATP-binding protein